MQACMCLLFVPQQGSYAPCGFPLVMAFPSAWGLSSWGQPIVLCFGWVRGGGSFAEYAGLAEYMPHPPPVVWVMAGENTRAHARSCWGIGRGVGGEVRSRCLL